MEIDPSALSPGARYQLMLGAVVPRPIAWTSTCDAAGRTNLAPFSFFGAFSTAPPTVGVAPGLRKGVPKDTLRNLRDTGEAVIAIPTEDTALAMVRTSGDYPPEISEFDAVGLTPRPASVVRPPLVGEAAVNLECRVSRIVDIGAQSHLVLCEIVRFHVRDDVLADGATAAAPVIDPRKLRAVARLGGLWYCRATDLFEIARSTV